MDDSDQAKRTTILIADDHELFRDGVRSILEQLESNVTVIEARDFADAISMAGSRPDLTVVLLDLNMPGMAWEQGLPAMRSQLPAEVPIIVLSASDNGQNVMHAIKLGAAGFIPKTSSSKIMISALKLVLSGGVYLPTNIIHAQAEPATREHNKDLLTPRQQEVLSLLREGKSNKEIARVLDLAEGTVKLHVTAILKALNVTNRTRAAIKAGKA
jgi:DNA-binding NarL/FixJ family response regulator